MNIEAKKISMVQQILSIDNVLIINELEAKITQLLHKNYTNKKSKKALSQEASALLLKINEGLPFELQKRYNDLSLKSVQKTLSPKEQKELITLVPKIENKTVERLKYLIELSQLWNMSVDDVMKKLEIKTPPPIHA